MTCPWSTAKTSWMKMTDASTPWLSAEKVQHGVCTEARCLYCQHTDMWMID
jgi:hypothetical protein